MIFIPIAGALVAVFAMWMLYNGAAAITPYRQNLREHGLTKIRVLPAQVIFIGGWGVGLAAGLAAIWFYFR